MILIVTNKQDVHPTPVIEYLNEQGCPVFRLNTEALLTDYQFHWWADGKNSDFYLKNVKNELEAYGHDIHSVWERRPVLPSELLLNNQEEINRHNLKEAAGFLSFLLHDVSDRFCIGHHLYDRSASSKIRQLRLAQALGMAVPATCFSNRKEDVIAFSRSFDYVMLKSIESDQVWLGGEQEYVFFGQRVASTSLLEQPEEAFCQSVNFVQEYVEKQYELRVTVVCDQVFACKIDSQRMEEDKGKVDWRQGYECGLHYEPYDLLDAIKSFCLKFLQGMHLNFGCFDFIVTPQDEFVFLECNPNGQWLWIEEETGMKISQAIAESLMRKCEKDGSCK